jgi:TonB-dependent receptor
VGFYVFLFEINFTMRVIKILLTTFLLVFLFSSVNAQKGFLRGSVFDGKTGEYLPGVTVYVEGTTLGTITDFDGLFSMELAPGTYQIRISFISYETIKIQDLQIEAGNTTLLENLKLDEASIQIEETVVTARAIRNTETALLTMKRKSVNLIDGISSGGLKKIGDSDAASSMKRITGVSVEGGKYVFVRGLGDRYTKTILNGLDIPGLDPDRNTLQMDIFPTNIIENLVVNKSFSADLPADFTGGVIDINIKDFPEEKKADISLSASYNPSSHFNPNYLTYQGGSTDFLGFDDGTRAIPATTNIPLFTEVVGRPDGEKGLRYREILQGFNPVMAATSKRSFMDYSFGTSWGNQFKVNQTTLGYILSLSYKNSTDFYDDAEYGRYGLSSIAEETEMETREFQKGKQGVNSVLISGLAGFALKTKHSKYRLNLLHLQNGETQAGIFDFYNSDKGAVFDGIQHNLDYSQRSLTNLFVHGKHIVPESSWEINWKFSPTFSNIIDPDIRFTRYEDRNGIYNIGTESGFPERIWRNLNETNMAAVLHITKDFRWNNQEAKLKFGGAYSLKERNFEIMNFMLNIRNIPLTGDPNELFLPENLWPYQGTISRGTTFEAPFIPVNPNQFQAENYNAAAYISAELSFLKNLKGIVGLRAEKFVQHYTGQDQLGTRVLDNEKVLDDLELFPTVNIIYQISETQNLRASYSKTIARPSFKELSYAEIFDPISGRTFIGGLFRDANDVAGIEYWDGNLVTSDIHNYDIRWELFGQNEQTISTSLFYKKFNNPIEMVQFSTQTGSFQPRNVGNGEVIGCELEIRQGLKPVSELLKNFTINLNFTATYSRIQLSKTEYDSRVDNARAGQTIDEFRDMAGQAPLILNAGFTYNGSDEGFGKGLTAGIFYNVQGQTLQYVGIVDRPDIYTVPFHSLNFNLDKKAGERLTIGLKMDNILNDWRESVFMSYGAANQYFSRLKPGQSFQLKISYSLF